MAAEDSELQLVIKAVDEASAILEKVRGEVASTAASTKAGLDEISSASQQSQSHVASLGRELAKIGAVVGVAALTKQFTDFGFGSASALQTTSTNMQLLVGNTAQANKVMGDLYEFSRGTPFAFPDVANAAKTLLQFGATAQNVVPITQMLGNVVAVTGAQYQTLAEVYGEVNAAGKVQMQNVDQLIQNGVPIMQAMATVTGKSMTDIQNAMQQGSLSAQVFDAAMQHIAPSDALNQMANTLPTRLSALQGALRSVAFEILGINIDPIKGFVVQAGGLFDQVSNAVATLAKRLRDPDMQNAMGQLGQAISGLASTVLPVLFDALGLLASHLNIIIPALVGVAVAFGLIKVTDLISGLVMASVGFYEAATAAVTFEGALGVVAVILAVLAGGLMFSVMNQMGNVSSSMGNATKAANDNSKANMDMAGAAGTNSKAQDNLANKMAEVSQAVVQANQDFNESLAQIVQTHQDKISTLTNQVQTEKDDFAKAQQQKTDDFKQSQADQLAAHQQSVDDLQKQLDDEVAKGRFADLRRITDLKDRLDKENLSYTQQTAKNQATYDKDTQNAKEASDDKLTKLTQQLKTETDFMTKHAADIQGIRASDALDEIDKLKQSHDRQLASLQKQKEDAINNASQQVTGIGNAMAPLPGMAANVGSQMGTQMASAFKGAFKSAIMDLWDWWYDWVHQHWDPWVNNFGNSIGNLLGAGQAGADLSKLLHTLHVPGFATGGVVPGAPGEPVFAVVHGGEVVTPPGEKFGGNANNISGPKSAPTFYNTFNVYSNSDLEHAMQMQAWQLRNA